MSQYSHSIVLFSGDDGLPIEFNIQNTVEKVPLKAMIEFGGGLCTLSEDAIYLVSPGTRVLNIGVGKQIISSRYIFDCVKENYLLDLSDYKIEINEMETSDFSEENSLKFAESSPKEIRESPVNDNSVNAVDPNKTVSPNLLECPESNHAFDFVDTENRSNIEKCKETSLSPIIPLQACETSAEVRVCEGELQPSRTSVDLRVCDGELQPNRTSEDVIVCEKENSIINKKSYVHPDSLEDLDISIVPGQNFVDVVQPSDHEDVYLSARDSPLNAVSSSQPSADGLDQFDNIMLKKLHEKPVTVDEDSLSQSYTVSSSADAQVKPSSHDISAEIFGASSAAPDSGSQTSERQRYIKDLEKEIEQILQKPSPKSLQDKTVLVKYICIVKKLPPANVLKILQNFKN